MHDDAAPAPAAPAPAAPHDVGARRVTIRAVAQHAGVSRQTVSNALNSPGRLSAATLARVRRSVTALGYRPDRAARALSSRRSGLIGIRVGPTAHRTAAHPDRLLHALVHAARPHGYRLLAFEAPYGDDEAEIAAYAELLAGHDVDAVVVADTHPGDRRPAWLAARGAAFAVHGRPWGAADPTHPWVEVDGALGTGLAVAHLVARGHRRIGFVGWPADGAGGDARRRGWREATHRLGLEPGADLTAATDDPAAAAAVVAPVLAHRSGSPDGPGATAPTAFVCASDVLALGVLDAVGDAGATPGRDVAVTGYDDSDLATLARPGLTSLRQPITLVAQTLVEQVLDRLGVLGRAPAPAGHVAPELVVRASSAGPAPRQQPHDRSTATDPDALPATRPHPTLGAPPVAPDLPGRPAPVLDGMDAVLFDLDGVLTPTAVVHRHAWSRLFTPLLEAHGASTYTDADYFAYIDGKPRYEGVRSLLESRGIDLPWGEPTDDPDTATVCGLGNRKNAVFTQVLESEGVAPYPGSVRLVDALVADGRQVAVVSSSRNAVPVLAAAGLTDRFALVVDGLVAAAQGLPGKPQPATYLYAAEQLGVPRERAVVVEDAESGVASGRAGAFGLVVGVDRGAGAAVLLEQGADLVVDDLDELVTTSDETKSTLP